MSSQTFFVEHLDTPTGRMRVVTDDRERVRAVDWEDYDERMHILLRRYYGPVGIEVRKAPQTTAALKALAAYFRGELDAIRDVQTAANGTKFQKAVWDSLRKIPAGHTTSYGALAAQIGQPSAARAVGLANGSNPVAIIVPCHRVIGANSALTGYGGGLDRKRWLLTHEQRTTKQGELWNTLHGSELALLGPD